MITVLIFAAFLGLLGRLLPLGRGWSDRSGQVITMLILGLVFGVFTAWVLSGMVIRNLPAESRSWKIDPLQAENGTVSYSMHNAAFKSHVVSINSKLVEVWDPFIVKDSKRSPMLVHETRHVPWKVSWWFISARLDQDIWKLYLPPGAKEVPIHAVRDVLK
jgi:hypothetical protein